ncbi:MAG: hypothetical protein HQL86_06895, partial [Magnetococcales bacterium]|nr:hypothetical protein [Magnetococcales bacterium]
RLKLEVHGSRRQGTSARGGRRAKCARDPEKWAGTSPPGPVMAAKVEDRQWWMLSQLDSAYKLGRNFAILPPTRGGCAVHLGNVGSV